MVTELKSAAMSGSSSPSSSSESEDDEDRDHGNHEQRQHLDQKDEGQDGSTPLVVQLRLPALGLEAALHAPLPLLGTRGLRRLRELLKALSQVLEAVGVKTEALESSRFQDFEDQAKERLDGWVQNIKRGAAADARTEAQRRLSRIQATCMKETVQLREVVQQTDRAISQGFPQFEHRVSLVSEADLLWKGPAPEANSPREPDNAPKLAQHPEKPGGVFGAFELSLQSSALQSQLDDLLRVTQDTFQDMIKKVEEHPEIGFDTIQDSMAGAMDNIKNGRLCCWSKSCRACTLACCMSTGTNTSIDLRDVQCKGTSTDPPKAQAQEDKWTATDTSCWQVDVGTQMAVIRRDQATCTQTLCEVPSADQTSQARTRVATSDVSKSSAEAAVQCDFFLEKMQDWEEPQAMDAWEDVDVDMEQPDLPDVQISWDRLPSDESDEVQGGGGAINDISLANVETERERPGSHCGVYQIPCLERGSREGDRLALAAPLPPLRNRGLVTRCWKKLRRQSKKEACVVEEEAASDEHPSQSSQVATRVREAAARTRTPVPGCHMEDRDAADLPDAGLSWPEENGAGLVQASKRCEPVALSASLQKRRISAPALQIDVTPPSSIRRPNSPRSNQTSPKSVQRAGKIVPQTRTNSTELPSGKNLETNPVRTISAEIPNYKCSDVKGILLHGTSMARGEGSASPSRTEHPPSTIATGLANSKAVETGLANSQAVDVGAEGCVEGDHGSLEIAFGPEQPLRIVKVAPQSRRRSLDIPKSKASDIRAILQGNLATDEDGLAYANVAEQSTSPKANLQSRRLSLEVPRSKTPDVSAMILQGSSLAHREGWQGTSVPEQAPVESAKASRLAPPSVRLSATAYTTG